MTESLTLEKNECPDIESSTLDYRQRFSGEVGRWFLQVQNYGLHQCLQSVSQASNVVDFGGGHGQNVDLAEQMGLDLTVTGSNLSCSQLLEQDIALQRCNFSVQSLLNSGFESKQFSVALSFRMLPHLSQWQAHIAELCRVAERAVIVEFPTLHSVNLFSHLLFDAKKKVERNTRPFHLFRVGDVVTEFEQHGFQLTQKYGQYVLPMALYRLLNNQRLAARIERLLRRLGLSSLLGSPVICLFQRKEI